MKKSEHLLAPRQPDYPIPLLEAFVDRELIQEICDTLKGRAVPENALPAQRYMKSEMPFLGVKTPERRKAVTAVLRQRASHSEAKMPWGIDCASIAFDNTAAKPDAGFLYWQHTLLAMWREACYREERYAVLDMAGSRYAKPFQTLNALPLYEEFVLTGAWWDFVDEISHRAADILMAQPHEMATVMREWAACNSVWKRRIAILCQLTLKGDTDRELLEDCIEVNLRQVNFQSADRKSRAPHGTGNFCATDMPQGLADSGTTGGSGKACGEEAATAFCDEFFIGKAIGWALRDYGRTAPEYVRQYVRTNEERMHSLTVREALKRLV